MTLCLNALEELYIRPPTNPLPQPHQPPQAASPITTPPSTGTPTPTRTLADANLPDQEVQDRCLRFPFLRGPLVLDKWPGYFKHAYRSCLVGAGGSFQLVPPAFFDWSCTSEFMRRKDPLAYTHTHTHTHTHTESLCTEALVFCAQEVTSSCRKEHGPNMLRQGHCFYVSTSGHCGP